MSSLVQKSVLLCSFLALALMLFLPGCSASESEGWALAPPWIVLFALGSPIWWLLFLALQVALLWAIANEDTGGRWGLGIVIVWALAMEFFGNMGFLTWITESPFWHVLTVVGIYLLGGGIWGPVWWIFRCSSRRHDYNDELTEFLRGHGIDTIPDELPENIAELWIEHLQESYEWQSRLRKTGSGDWTCSPSIWEEKVTFMKHMAWWPWSICWCLFADVFRGVWRAIYTVYSRMLERISRWSFSGTEGHLNPGKKKDDE